jgi:hypothetical protein
MMLFVFGIVTVVVQVHVPAGIATVLPDGALLMTVCTAAAEQFAAEIVAAPAWFATARGAQNTTAPAIQFLTINTPLTGRGEDSKRHAARLWWAARSEFPPRTADAAMRL